MGDFVIRRKSFSVVVKIPYVKIQSFRNRSFTWFLIYFLAKFLEISNDWIVSNRQVSAKTIRLKTVVLHNTADRAETVFGHLNSVQKEVTNQAF